MLMNNRSGKNDTMQTPLTVGQRQALECHGLCSHVVEPHSMRVAGIEAGRWLAVILSTDDLDEVSLINCQSS
jgi:hypothetical protein